MVGKLIRFPGRRVVDPYDYEIERQIKRQKILEKLALTPKKIAVTGLAGAVAGFLIQQNRGTLDQLIYLGSPYSQFAAASVANGLSLAGKSVYFNAVTGKHRGHSTNLETDLKYLGVFNSAGILGYLVGNVKDLIT